MSNYKKIHGYARVLNKQALIYLPGLCVLYVTTTPSNN